MRLRITLATRSARAYDRVIRPDAESIGELAAIQKIIDAIPSITIIWESVREMSGLDPVNDKSHHNPSGGFTNPWPSFRNESLWAALLYIRKNWNAEAAKVPPQSELFVKVLQERQMAWERIRNPPKDRIQATWLGHASFLVQMEGVNILTDPIWSHRCSPFQWLGPSRFTQPPCPITSLPPIDIVLISHSHYDHLDINTISSLGPNISYYVPLGNKAWFTHNFSKYKHVKEMDWWDEHTWKSADEKKQLKIACTPCQHFSGRGIFDRNQTLWSSWSILGQKRYFFGGDTGYRSVADGQDEETVPRCPAFRQIGDKYGPFDLACIPIGAYSPRHIMSPVHCSPADSVLLHHDIKSKFSVGMHWGTFVLTDEPVNQPPQKLKEALAKNGKREDEFVTIDIGETTSS